MSWQHTNLSLATRAGRANELRGEAAADREGRGRAENGLPAGWSAVLADPVRRRIYGLVASREEVGAAELSEPLGIAEPAVGHHLWVLRRAGLVDCEQRGREVFYRLGVLAGRALATGLLPAGAST